jgi:HEAT repeat protein
VPEAVRRRLADSDPKVRAEGLRALKGRVDEAAARAIVPLLDDRDPYCRDYACWTLLARAEDPAAVAVLVDRGPRASTNAGRLAAADALAEAGGAAAVPALARLVTDRDARVRETALDGLARTGAGEDPQVPARVRAALADPEPGVRAAALSVLAAWKAPDAADAARRALADADPGVRTAAACLLHSLDAAGFASAFPDLVKDTDWGVRLVAAARAPTLGPVPPVETLAAMLGDPRLRVADAAHDALRAISGLDLPPETGDWLGWWERTKSNWKGTARGAAGRDSGRPSVAAYHGLPFRSDALLFVIDLSGSMDQPLGAVDRRPRVEVAAEELARTLNALPDRARADVLAFMLDAPRAAGRLQALEGGTRDRLARWFAKQARGRKGDLGRALVAAVLDGDADTVLFLGDGAASAGDCLFRERIRERLRQALRLRPVALHAVAFGSKVMDRQFLEEITALAGGRCIER